ncbi:MerR family transcriptional regulator [Nocardia yamanashiensis]|uniref:MerR family transcriptional regulator n=1 Tax=Nocardia yamanashiensis TaxID=209247 RepID=UPI000831668E|nr:MerR family transcriptional regulator [Nocardia yamanashiensis]
MGAAEYTIDDLARAAGTTVRSVRVYHERGVLQPPAVRGRTGYYGEEHLNRVRTITRLLERGIKLNGIKELLAAWDRGEDLGRVLGVSDSDIQPVIADATELIPATELQERFADVPDGLARVVTAGVFQPVDAANYRIADPELAHFLDRLAAAGVPNTDILRELERLHADCDRIARRSVDLLQQFAFEPYTDSERTAADLARFADRVSAVSSLLGPTTATLVNRLVEQRLKQDPDLAEVLNS